MAKPAKTEVRQLPKQTIMVSLKIQSLIFKNSNFASGKRQVPEHVVVELVV